MAPPPTLVNKLVVSHLLVGCLAYSAAIHFRSDSPSKVTQPLSCSGTPKGSGRLAPLPGPAALSKAGSSADGAPLPAYSALLSYWDTTGRAIRGWTADQVLESLRALTTEPMGPEKTFSQQLLLSRLTEIDPMLALSYASSLPAPDNQTSELNILGTWARLDPVAAATHFVENANDFGILNDRQRAAARTIAQQWAQTNPLEAFEWANRLPEEVQIDALGPVIAKLSLTQSDRVIEAINERPPGPERTEMITQMAAERTHHAPQQTADWAANLTDPEERDEATAAVVARWANTDLSAAATWVRSQPAGPTRDTALRSLLESASFRENPALALRWTDSIQDENSRQEVVASIVNRWEVVDPDGAAQWMNDQPR